MFRSVALSALLLAVLSLSACSRSETHTAPVRAVKLIKVGTQGQDHVQEYAAEVRARTESRLGFQVAGKLQQRLVEVGQSVRAGQVLAVLDPQDYQANAQAAAAQLLAAQSQRDLAAADLRRYESLRDQGFISGAEFERRQVSLKAAEASLKQAQAQASVQGNQAAYTRLLADADGVIVGADAEPGQVLAAGTPVVRLARSGPRDVVFAVPEDEVARIQKGQVVQVRGVGQGASTANAAFTLKAQVREVAASADPATRTFAVKAALDDARLALGTTAVVKYNVPASAQSAPAIRLPQAAVWLREKSSSVWVFDAQQSVVKARAVQISDVNGNWATVASGLEPGEEVVAVGVHALTEGQKVTRLPSAQNTGDALPAEGQQP